MKQRHNIRQLKYVALFLFNFICFLCHSCLERSVIFYLVAVVVLLFQACRNLIIGLCSVCCHSVIFISVRPSACLSVRMQELDSHLTGFRKS
jgi:hypothetical protein